MNKKRVMILGAAEGQMPFIHICQEKGYEIFVVSVWGNYPGFQLADKCFYVDTKNKEKILEIAQEERIDAILTDQTDVSVPTVAYVSEKLGLRSIGYERSLLFSNKYLMRSAAKALGVNCPNFCKATTYQEAIISSASFHYPLIMKPIDSSGSRGVRKVCTRDELKNYFDETKQFSGSGTVIIEEYITGKEYLADGIALDNHYYNLDLGIKEYFNKPDMYISKMCMFTSAMAIDDPIEKAVLETNKMIVEGFGLPFGLTHAEYIVRESDKKVFLVEIAARGGGVFLSSDLTPRACGLDTNRIIIDYIVDGKRTNIDCQCFAKDTAAWVCFELHPGRIVDIKGIDETRKIPGVFMVNVNKLSQGMIVEETTDDTKKHGPILIHSHSREECYKAIQLVRKTLNVTVEDNGKIYNAGW